MQYYFATKAQRLKENKKHISYSSWLSVFLAKNLLIKSIPTVEVCDATEAKNSTTACYIKASQDYKNFRGFSLSNQPIIKSSN